MFLIIGCGYVGERVADLLAGSGHAVAGVTHSKDSAARMSSTKSYAVHAADVSDKSSLQVLASLLQETPQAILHCASSSKGGADTYRKVHLAGCSHLQEVFPQAHLHFTSSTSVYPQVDGSRVGEESDASPDRETSQILRQTEDLVLRGGGTVARLAGIYGPQRSFVLKSFLGGNSTIEGNAGQGRYLNQIHRDDAAGALVHLLNLGSTGLFNVTDDRPVTQLECYSHLAAFFKRPLPATSERDTSRKRAWTSKRVSNAKLRKTGFILRYPSYFEALELDADLVPSILAQLMNTVDAEASRDT